MILKQKPVLRNTLVLLLLLLSFAEITTRIVFAWKNYPVGKLAPTWMALTDVDSLVTQQSCFTDSRGIYKLKKTYWAQQNIHINNENFRGRDFSEDTLHPAALSLLFIGDSFVWGAHATPIDSCFVDLLDSDTTLVCYNAGVPGTDPAQYAAVAERYVPRVKPDITVVCIYLANDMMGEKRQLAPNEELWYQTNAGWLPAFYKGKHFASAQEAYNYVTNKYAANTVLKKLLLKSALGTALLSLPLRLEEYTEWRQKRKSPVTNEYLREIQSVCSKYNSRFAAVIIPSAQTDLTKDFSHDASAYVRKQYPALTHGIENSCFILPAKKEMYYAPPDGHLNNSGHRFAAEYIRTAILSATPP